MNISETCACGASASITTDGLPEAFAYMATWRTSHLCPVRHELSEKLGYDLLSRKGTPHV